MWSHYFWFLTILILVSDYVQSFREGQSRMGKPYGRISKKKCAEYSKLRNELYGNADAHKCKSLKKTKIIGGERATDGEFPHMAIFRSKEDSFYYFQCDASLISNQYLLTSAHCGSRYEVDMVAMLGSNDRDSELGKWVKVSERIPHPDYNPSNFYNDIALLRLSEPVKFTQFIWPACLQTDDNVKPKEAIATGWGHKSYSGYFSDDLFKVSLPLATISDCKKTYPPAQYLRSGVDENKMFCAGGKNVKTDTCNANSGGPLETLITEFKCMYNIIGIASYGKESCGGDISIYTKVSSFIPWIESIVWPNEK